MFSVVKNLFCTRSRLLATLHGHKGPIIGLAISPNGKFLASRGKWSLVNIKGKCWDKRRHRWCNGLGFENGETNHYPPAAFQRKKPGLVCLLGHSQEWNRKYALLWERTRLFGFPAASREWGELVIKPFNPYNSVKPRNSGPFRSPLFCPPCSRWGDYMHSSRYLWWKHHTNCDWNTRQMCSGLVIQLDYPWA